MAASSGTTSTTVAGATPTYTQAEWDAALAAATKVRQEMANGGDFAALAKQYSNDPVRRTRVATSGCSRRVRWCPSSTPRPWALKLNEISQPVKTQYGYHLIQVTEITPAKQQTFAEVKETIRTDLLNTEKRKVWDAWLAKIELALGVTFKAGMAPTTTTTGAADASGNATVQQPTTTSS